MIQKHHVNKIIIIMSNFPLYGLNLDSSIARETVFIVKRVCYEHLTERHNNCLVANTRSIKIFTDACHIVKDRLESYIRNTARCTLGSS